MIKVNVSFFNNAYSLRATLEKTGVKRIETVKIVNNNIGKIIITKEKLLLILDKRNEIVVDVYKYEDSIFKYERSYSEILWEV